MLTIQDVGIEIMEGRPRSFYVFGGSEFGVKCRYIDMIRKLYPEYHEVGSVASIINLGSTKRIFPLQPATYVIRYDEDFIASLSDKTQATINSLNVPGCVICIYENSKHLDKLAKYLPDSTVIIGAVGAKLIQKYLHIDFPHLPDRFINIAASSCDNYGHARLVCNALAHTEIRTLYEMSDADIISMLGLYRAKSDKLIRLGVASKNFKYLVDIVDNLDAELDSVFYTILSTLLEIEKLMLNSRAESDLREYVKLWTLEDIYNMFNQTYHQLKLSRSISPNKYNSLVFLFSLLRFSHVPQLEAVV